VIGAHPVWGWAPILVNPGNDHANGGAATNVWLALVRRSETLQSLWLIMRLTGFDRPNKPSLCVALRPECATTAKEVAPTSNAATR
jgi:hypothetical protein